MIKIIDASFKYIDDNQYIFKNVNLNFEEGKIYALTGPSGRGKTTLLRTIVGLQKLSQGKIEIDGKVVDEQHINIHPNKRGVGLVFQDYSLFPHLNVYKNIMYGAKNKSLVEELIETMELEKIRDSAVYNLSGGQQQRVAIARTIASMPKAVLLDEPFSNLDKEIKEQIKDLIRKLNKKYEMTFVIVSHNEQDYGDLADEVIVL